MWYGKPAGRARARANGPQSQQLQPAISTRAGQRPLQDRERGSEWKLRNKSTASRGRKQGHVAEKEGSYVPEQRLIRDLPRGNKRENFPLRPHSQLGGRKAARPIPAWCNNTGPLAMLPRTRCSMCRRKAGRHHSTDSHQTDARTDGTTDSGPAHKHR